VFIAVIGEVEVEVLFFARYVVLSAAVETILPVVAAVDVNTVVLLLSLVRVTSVKLLVVVELSFSKNFVVELVKPTKPRSNVSGYFCCRRLT